MTSHPPAVDRLLSRTSQARLSELLNIVVQGMKAIDDEYSGLMGPDGEGWAALLDEILPGTSDSVLSRGFNPANSNTALPQATSSASTNRDLGPLTVAEEYQSTAKANPKHSTGVSVIPAAATPMELTDAQRHKEWGLMVHYMDVRAKMTVDQLAQAHAAFARWSGWAPSLQDMRRAREAARAPLTLTGIHGPWCIPFSTEIWLKAVRDQSIADIKELKKTKWTEASQVAAFVGVRLKKEDKPRPKPAVKQPTDLASSSANSLIVKLKLKADSTPHHHALDQLQHRFHYQQTNDLSQFDHQTAALPFTGVGAQQPQFVTANQQFGPNNDISHYIQNTLPDGFGNQPPVGMAAMTGNFGIDPNLTIRQPMESYSGLDQYPALDQMPPIQTTGTPLFPVSTPANWPNPFPWITERAASLGRSLLPSSQDQAGVSAQSGQIASTLQGATKTGVTDVDTASKSGRQDHPAHTEGDDGAGPSAQLFSEMAMRLPTTEKQSKASIEKAKKSEGDQGATHALERKSAPSTAKDHNPLKSHTEPSSKQSAAKSVAENGKKHQSTNPKYNYAADLTPNPRVNALIAYISATWRIKHKVNLLTDTAAIDHLVTHATAALPALLNDSLAKTTTRGLLRWKEQEMTWELELEQIDTYATRRALVKKELEEMKGAPAVTTSQPSTQQDHQPAAAATQTPRTPPSTMTKTVAPKPEPPAYPDASIVAISELTPDPRANAFAAHLAQLFHAAHGIDLMADEAGRRRLMLHATRNEFRVRGARELANYEINFHANRDLSWKMTGFGLDELEREWVARFPPPEESDAGEGGDGADNDDDDDDDDAADGGEAGQSDGDGDGDVRMTSDNDDDGEGPHAAAAAADDDDDDDRAALSVDSSRDSSPLSTISSMRFRSASQRALSARAASVVSTATTKKRKRSNDDDGDGDDGDDDAQSNEDEDGDSSDVNEVALPAAYPGHHHRASTSAHENDDDEVDHSSDDDDAAPSHEHQSREEEQHGVGRPAKRLRLAPSSSAGSTPPPPVPELSYSSSSTPSSGSAAASVAGDRNGDVGDEVVGEGEVSEDDVMRRSRRSASTESTESWAAMLAR